MSTSGKPHLRARHRNPVVAGHGGLQAAAQGMTVNGRDDGLRAVFKHLSQAHGLRASRLAQMLDVGAGDEPAPGADEHHGSDLRIRVRSFNAVDDALGHARTQRVHGRIVHGDDANGAHTFKGDEFAHEILRKSHIRQFIHTATHRTSTSVPNCEQPFREEEVLGCCARRPQGCGRRAPMDGFTAWRSTPIPRAARRNCSKQSETAAPYIPAYRFRCHAESPSIISIIVRRLK